MRKTMVHAKHHEQGMAIYVKKGTEDIFVMTHRKNNNLYFFLCDEGKSLAEIKEFRPNRKLGSQKLGHSLDHIVRVTEYVLAEVA